MYRSNLHGRPCSSGIPFSAPMDPQMQIEVQRSELLQNIAVVESLVVVVGQALHRSARAWPPKSVLLASLTIAANLYLD